MNHGYFPFKRRPAWRGTGGFEASTQSVRNVVSQAAAVVRQHYLRSTRPVRMLWILGVGCVCLAGIVVLPYLVAAAVPLLIGIAFVRAVRIHAGWHRPKSLRGRAFERRG